MPKQSDYDALVEDVARAIYDARMGDGAWNDLLLNAKTHEISRPTGTERQYLSSARAAFAVVRERLATITPAMVKAWEKAKPEVEFGHEFDRDLWTNEKCAAADWLAMLNASPLAEGQSATVREEGEGQ